MRHWIAWLTIVLLAVPFAAQAQPIEGPYVGAAGGLALPQNVRVTPESSGFGGSHLRLEDNLGYAVSGSLGYGLPGGWRVEVEGDFLHNGIDTLARTTPSFSANGDVQSYGVMANALYDLDIGNPYIFPYLGIGAGYMWSHLNGVTFASSSGAFAFHSDETTGAFAWQAIVGLAFPIPRRPGLSLTAQYRFLEITGGEHFSGAAASTAGSTPSQIELGAQYSHSFMLGVRYAFNVPPPAPPPAPAPVAAPAPAPARSYLVFFDWDKATLTTRARQIIREAAVNSTHVQYTRIAVNGYTDTSGSAKYNMGLSLRRANAVAAELVRDGVPKNVIAIRGFGETHLLVPTGPGVREPQNRRVEIIIR